MCLENVTFYLCKGAQCGLDKSAHHNTIKIEPCPTWLDASTTLKNFADKVDDFKITQVTDTSVEFVGQSMVDYTNYQWVISAQQVPQQSGSYPSHAFDDQFVINTQLRQFDKKRNKFVTVRHGQMPVQHDVGFEQFVGEMCATFELPQAAIVSSAPDGAAAAYAEIKSGPGGQSQLPIVGTPASVMGVAVVPAEVIREPEVIETFVAELEAAAEQGVEKPTIASIAKPASTLPAVKKHPKGGHLFDLPVPQDLTQDGKVVFIAHEFELGMQKARVDEKDFNFTSNIELSAAEAEAIAFKIIDAEMAKNSAFELKQVNEYRVEAVLVEHENGVVKTTTLRYRYPQIKESGAQKGIEAGNLECEVVKINTNISGTPTRVSIITNLHLCITP